MMHLKNVFIAVCRIKGKRYPIATCGTLSMTVKGRGMLDYLQGDTTPHYPVPATFGDCLANHEQWRVLQRLRYWER